MQRLFFRIECSFSNSLKEWKEFEKDGCIKKRQQFVDFWNTHHCTLWLCVKCFLLFFNLKTGVFCLTMFSLNLNIDISMKCQKKLPFTVSPENSWFISHYQLIHIYVNVCFKSSYCSQSVLSAYKVCRILIEWFSISGVNTICCRLQADTTRNLILKYLNLNAEINELTVHTHFLWSVFVD